VVNAVSGPLDRLTAAQRLSEVAAILATGMLRLGAGSGKSRPPESRFGWTTRPAEACMRRPLVAGKTPS
jgi:hypothetical protein